MTIINDNQQLPIIQLLVPACRTIADGRYTWLHGYCLITVRFDAGDVQLAGEVRIGNRFWEDLPLITRLAESLDPDAVLAGLDLTDMISRLSGLPIDVKDSAPALALLGKLQAMLEDQVPIDLALHEDGQNAVVSEVVVRGLNFAEHLNDDTIRVGAAELTGANIDSGNPAVLAETLADTASACLLSIGKLYLMGDQRTKLQAAWLRWRHELVPSRSPMPDPSTLEDNTVA